MHLIEKIIFKNKVIFFAILTLVFCWPFLSSKNNLGIQDWDHHFAFLESSRNTILHFGQIPYWNPYHCGGMPALGHPQSGIISLTFLLVLIFGTIYGVKLSIFLHLLIALIGMYSLSRYLKLSVLGSLLSSAIFSFSGATFSTIASGMLPFLYFSYLPIIVLYFLKSFNETKNSLLHVLLSAFVLSLTYYGGYQIPLVVLPVLIAFGITKVFSRKNLYALNILITFIAGFIVFSFPKLILNFALMNEFPRFFQDLSGYSIKNFFLFLLVPIQPLDNLLPFNNFYEGVDENSIYIVIFAFTLSMVGFTKISTKNKLFVLLVIWLMLGFTVPLSIYSYLKLFPIYDQFRIAQRFRFVFLLLVSLMAAKGLMLVEERTKKLGLAALLTIVIVVDLYFFNTNNFIKHSFIIKNNFAINPNFRDPPTTVNNSTPVYLWTSDNYINKPDPVKYLPWSSEYIAAANNMVTIDCAEGIPINTGRTSVGQNFLLNAYDVAYIKKWSPNEIFISIQGRFKNRILINQNYISGWFAYDQNSRQLKVVSERGRIAVHTESDTSLVVLKYKPYLKIVQTLSKKMRGNDI